MIEGQGFADLSSLRVGAEPGSRGLVRLEPGAHAQHIGTAGPLVIGGPAGSEGVVVLQGDAASPDETVFVVSDGFDTTVGGPSAAPAAELLPASGTLQLLHASAEFRGTGHDLVIERLGTLQSTGGRLVIESSGALVNRGLVAGDLLLEGTYAPTVQGTTRATILAVEGPGPRRRALSPLAEAGFPRRALRAKPALPAFGPLVVTGDATLDGRVELQFGNGVAPRLGEAFEVLDVAGTVTGSFAEVAIRGLVPGSFAFEPSLRGREADAHLDDGRRSAPGGEREGEGEAQGDGEARREDQARSARATRARRWSSPTPSAARRRAGSTTRRSRARSSSRRRRRARRSGCGRSPTDARGLGDAQAGRSPRARRSRRASSRGRRSSC